MLVSHFIHLLELVTAVLFALLAFQLVRCYRAEISAKSNLVSPVEDEPITVSEPVMRVVESQSKVSSGVIESAKKTQGSEAILHDYIGGFFESSSPEPETTNIEAFRAPVSERVVAVPTLTPVIVEPLLSKSASADEAMEEQAEEDTIILVEQQPDPAESANVMSEKVVHAMLDEAKLVCAS